MYYKSNRTGLADYLRAFTHPGGLIICEEKKFLYMKPAKAAGTSILREGLEKDSITLIHYKDHPQHFNKWLSSITDEELKHYFIFSVTRNPWDRFVSLAKHVGVPVKKLAADFPEYRKQERIRVHSIPISTYTHLNGTPFVDFVCRTECLQADMNLVFDQIKMPRRQVAHANRTRHAHYSAYYTEKEIEAVASFYTDDIKNFGYTFEQTPKPFSRFK